MTRTPQRRSVRRAPLGRPARIIPLVLIIVLVPLLHWCGWTPMEITTLIGTIVVVVIAPEPHLAGRASTA